MVDPVQSAAAVRVGAVVETSADTATAINRAVSANACEWLLVVSPGFRLAPSCIERCDEMFRTHPTAAAILLAVRVTSADGRFSADVSYSPAGFVDLAADPRQRPPFLQ